MFSKHSWLCSLRVHNCPTLPLAIPVSCAQVLFLVHLVPQVGLVSSRQTKSPYSYKAEGLLWPRLNFKRAFECSNPVNVFTYIFTLFNISIKTTILTCHCLFVLIFIHFNWDTKKSVLPAFYLQINTPVTCILPTKWDIYSLGHINKQKKENSIKKRRPWGDPVAIYNQLSRGCRKDGTKFFSEMHSERRGKG